MKPLLTALAALVVLAGARPTRADVWAAATLPEVSVAVWDPPFAVAEPHGHYAAPFAYQHYAAQDLHYATPIARGHGWGGHAFVGPGHRDGHGRGHRRAGGHHGRGHGE